MTDKEKEALLLLAGWSRMDACYIGGGRTCWAESIIDLDTAKHFGLDDAFKRMTNDNE